MSTLAVLINRTVDKTELVGLDTTLEMSMKLVTLSTMPRNIVVIPFDDRTSDRFRGFVRRLRESNSSPVSVWSRLSIDCGCFIAESIADVNFTYIFDFGDEGPFTFATTDLCDRMAVDSYEDDDGCHVMEIITQGENWFRIDY